MVDFFLSFIIYLVEQHLQRRRYSTLNRYNSAHSWIAINDNSNQKKQDVNPFLFVFVDCIFCSYSNLSYYWWCSFFSDYCVISFLQLFILRWSIWSFCSKMHWILMQLKFFWHVKLAPFFIIRNSKSFYSTPSVVIIIEVSKRNTQSTSNVTQIFALCAVGHYLCYSDDHNPSYRWSPSVDRKKTKFDHFFEHL